MSLIVGGIKALQEGRWQCKRTFVCDEPVFLYDVCATCQTFDEVFRTGIMNGMIECHPTREPETRTLSVWFGRSWAWCQQTYELIVAVGSDGVSHVHPVAHLKMFRAAQITSDTETLLLRLGVLCGNLILSIYGSIGEILACLFYHQYLRCAFCFHPLAHIAQSGMGRADVGELLSCTKGNLVCSP